MAEDEVQVSEIRLEKPALGWYPLYPGGRGDTGGCKQRRSHIKFIDQGKPLPTVNGVLIGANGETCLEAKRLEMKYFEKSQLLPY